MKRTLIILLNVLAAGLIIAGLLGCWGGYSGMALEGAPFTTKWFWSCFGVALAGAACRVGAIKLKHGSIWAIDSEGSAKATAVASMLRAIGAVSWMVALLVSPMFVWTLSSVAGGTVDAQLLWLSAALGGLCALPFALWAFRIWLVRRIRAQEVQHGH